jgi:hypothetical protein
MTVMKRLAALLDSARQAESKLASSIEGRAERAVGAAASQPLEIVHAVVEAVAREIQPVGRGERAFPYNDLRITLLAPSERGRIALRAIVEGPVTLKQRILDRLTSAGCRPGDLDVTVAFASRRTAAWTSADFHLELRRLDRPARPMATEMPRLELTVIAGTAGRTVYRCGPQGLTLGRGVEVTDGRGHLVRTNQLAFLDSHDEVNETVSRLHAHIAYSATDGLFRVFDDGSARGTSVHRDGRGLRVPAGKRGTGLMTNDELVIGRARLRVKIIDGTAGPIARSE